MHIVWLILKILGFSLLGLLGLVLVLLLIPVGADLKYADDELSVYLKVLFLRFKILPSNKKKRKEKPPEKEEKSEPKKEKFSLNTLEQIKDVISPAKKAAGYMLKKIKIKNVRVFIEVSRADIADTGIMAGNLWAGIGVLLEALKSIFTVEVKEFMIKPDFESEQNKFGANINAAIRTLPIYALAAAIIFLKRWQQNKHQREDANDGEPTPPDRNGRNGGRKDQGDIGQRNNDRQAG